MASEPRHLPRPDWAVELKVVCIDCRRVIPDEEVIFINHPFHLIIGAPVLMMEQGPDETGVGP
jgi:hypothetical protein